MNITTTPHTAAPRPTADALLTQGIAAWLASIGCDPTSPEFADTPHRVVRAWREFAAGFADDPAEHLGRTFPSRHSGETIAVTGVPFSSMCGHHLIPFSGTATIAYKPRPGAHVVGLSKLPRLLDVYAKRPQTQEQLTQQVVTALDAHLDTLGSACIIRSEHGCLAHRGAKKPGTAMITTAYTGVYRDVDTRSELHALTH